MGHCISKNDKDDVQASPRDNARPLVANEEEEEVSINGDQVPPLPAPPNLDGEAFEIPQPEPNPKMMRKALILFFKAQNYLYDEIAIPETLPKVYYLFFHNHFPALDDDSDPMLLCYVGAYYMLIKRDAKQAKIYYHIATHKGSSEAMGNLSCMYSGLNFNKNKEYRLKAIEAGNIQSMCDWGMECLFIDDYANMAKYWEQAIESHYTPAMFYYGLYHENRTQNTEEMLKYYRMAIERGHIDAMFQLARYYANQNELPEMKTLLWKALDQLKIEEEDPSVFIYENDETVVISLLASYYRNHDHNLEEIQRLLNLSQEHNLRDQTQELESLIKAIQSENRPPVAVLAEPEDPDLIVCIICRLNRRNCQFRPCRHSALCHICAEKIRTDSGDCPICKQPIREVLDFMLC